MKNEFTNLFRYFCANTPQNAGGGNSQFQRSESVRSTLAGRRLSNTLITHESPTNHPLKQSVWKVAAMLLMVLTLGVGNAWAACDPGVIFKFEVKNGLTNANVATGDNVDLSSYINLTAGSVSAKVVSAGNLTVINQKYLNVANKGNAYFICNLPSECTLQAGDVITYSIGGQNFSMQAATNSSDANKLALNKPSTAYNSLTITIPAGHNLIGKSTFYLFAASNSGAIKSIEIVRPATITLNATANGGTAVDAVKGVVGGKAVLTHAFKKDADPVKYYKFKGWYAAPSGGSPVANYYEVTGDETLYAQFEDNPADGVMFSFAMQSSMKPSAEVVVKNASGFVQELDLLQYATITGGAAKLKNNNSSAHAKITTSGQISLAGQYGNIQIDLDFPLAVGDVIAPNVSAKTWITTASATARPSSGPYADNNTATKTYTLKEGDAIVGATSFKLWQNSNATTTTITITRPAPACTAPAAPTISSAGDKTSFTEGETITLTASHDGSNHSATTTYQWFKGATFATASSVQAAATGSSGYTFTKTAATSDEGTYWCEAANSTCKSHNATGFAIEVAAAAPADPVITGAVNEAGWGSVTDAITVTSGRTISISSNVLTCDEKTLTATATAATAEYTYAFVNWTGVTNGAEVTTNVTATANFSRTANSYELAWDENAEDADDLEGEYTSGTVAYGSDITKPNTPTRDGYDFLGWAESSSGDVVEVPTTMPAANKTYYAKWAADPCSEPDKVTNEIARFFVPCGLSNSKGDGSQWNVSSVAASTGDNTFSTASYGGTNKNTNWHRNTTTGLIYGKLTSNNDSYISLKLNSGNFKAGDVVTAYVKTGNDLQLSKGEVKAFGTATASGVTGEYKCSITLAADNVESDGSIKIMRTSSMYVNRIIVTREGLCAAGDPGNISKGEASGGTGKITLKVEDDGEPVTGDAWYWQSSASGEDKTDEYDAENGKEVNAAGTYYLRSYNTSDDCWSAAKSVTVAAADLLTAITPSLSYSSSVVAGNTLSPTVTGNDGSGTVTYALNNVSPAGSLTIDENTGVVTAVTVGGTATVTATIAANGNYAGNTATSELITVVAPATGTATVSFALSGSSTTGTVTGVSTISSLSTSFALSTLSIGNAKSGYSGQVTGMPTELSETAYADIQFTVASGYTFTPSSVTLQVNPTTSTGSMHVVAKLMDGNIAVTSNDITLSKGEGSGMDNDITFASGAFTDKEFAGTVHLRIFMYNVNTGKNCYIKSPISITGTVAAEVTKYNLSFAKGSDAASGEMSTLKYAEDAEVTLPACTFTAPTGKEFDAWVVTKTVGGASVTVTNGKFTMPAEAVTATATWKDRAKHTDATLSDLTVGGTTVTGFAAGTISYNVELPFGTFTAPTVAATATDAEYVKSVDVTQATSTSGDATVVVTAEDGTTTKTYTIHFSVEASKDIELVWATDKQRCDATTPSAVVKSNNAAVSTYINQITFTNVEGDGDDGAEGSSLNVGKKAGNMFTLTAKAGYAFKAMTFFAKINDATCEFSLDGGEWTTLTSTNTSSDACYSDIFSETEVHEFRLRSTATKGVWIRNMQLTMIQACTPKTIAWTAEPAAEYEVGASVDPIAASANNGTVSYASNDADVIAVNSSNGALTISALGTVMLSASVPAGDGVIYCDEAANAAKSSINTYFLVTFDKQNGTPAIENKYYKNDDAIALPSKPSYPGYEFQGWFDAETGGNKYTAAITPAASMTVYAQWVAQCDGATITTQPTGANYITGRIPANLVCEATAGNGGALTYEWFTCDDALKTNPVAATATPSTAVVGTFYYFCKVTEAGCDVEAFSDVVTITVADKDPVCIIKATPTSENEATADGAYKGDAAIKSSNKKLSSKYDYVAVQLMEGKSFLATDKVVLNQAADLGDASDITKFYIYNEVPTADNLVVTVNNALPQKGDNWFNMPAEMAGESVFYIGRKDASCNPTVGYLAVYRTMMPELRAITIDGRAGVIDEANKAVAVTIPYEADLENLTVVPTIVWNEAAATNSIVVNDGSAWTLGPNTYKLTDKDGDATTYTITLTRDDLKYAVSYNMHGGTPAIEDELVVAGGKIAAAPADPTREDYIFQGWSLTDGGEIINIANVTINENKEFHAVWVSDGGIKLLDGSTVNTTNFITGVAATTVSISGDDYDCVAFGGTVKNVNASNMKNLNSHVTYNATTTQTKIRLSLYNSNGSKRTIYVKGVVEGTDNIVDLAAIELNGNEKKTTEYIEFNNAKNRSIYIFVSSDAGDIKILQVKVFDDGATLKQAGEIGYSLNMNKGRMFGASGATIAFEGLSYTLNGDYTPLSSEVLKMKSASVSFTTTVPVQLSVATATTDKTYYITRGSAGTDNPNTRSTKLNLSEPGTWYITAGGSEVQFTNISFDYPQVEITENAGDAAVIAGADVTIKEGKTLTLSEAHEIHNLVVENGGKVTLNNTLTVENLYLEAQAGASGQVLGATNVTANAVYMDVTFFKGDNATTLNETTAGRWYMISAPFDVNLKDGFTLTDGTPMKFGVSGDGYIFDLFEYDGAKRASTGNTGWKRAQGKMKAGTACLIGFVPGQPTTIRLKAASTVLSEPTSIALNEYAGDAANQNWNGVANPTLHYTNISKDVQTYNNEDGENGRKYIAYSSNNTSFVVGTAFFVQATGQIDLSAATYGTLRAPSRGAANERIEACVQIFREEATEFADQMYIRASEDATNEYEQGHDMITWNGTTASTAMIWANNYGKRLAIEEAPLVNDKASYALGMYAPKAGEYRIATTSEADADIYLTKDGMIIWNLSMSACTLTLNKGNNDGYGLLLVKKAPEVATGVENGEVLNGANGVQKVIIDEHVYILRDGQMYDVTGKIVK